MINRDIASLDHKLTKLVSTRRLKRSRFACPKYAASMDEATLNLTEISRQHAFAYTYI